METITYNDKQYTDGVTLIREVCKQESKAEVEKYYNEIIFPSSICPRCVVTDKKLTYRVYISYGRKCGSVVNKIYSQCKDVEATKKALEKDFFYVEELNGYFFDWNKIAVSATRGGANEEQKKSLYNKYILNDTKCRLASCNNKVPYEQTKTNACCTLHYNRDFRLKKGIYTTDDLTYQCAIDGEKFPSLSRLSRHIIKLQMSLEDYYKKYVEPSATGTCKWCCKPVPFYNVETGYRNFCHNTSCNVLWHNKFENRNDNGEKISQRQKESQNMPNQKGYWLKRGYTEEEAKEKVRERQTTNSVEAIMKRKNCSKEEAIEIRKDITKKWAESFPKLNYSMVSQRLFWSIYEKIKETFPDIYFATFDQQTKQKDDSGTNHEYQLKTKTSIRYPDFFIPEINKIIEFDGIYWHGEVGRGNKASDEKREEEICEVLNDCKIFRVREDEYNKNPEKILNNCLEFLLEPPVLKEIKQAN
jgi:hypothetical protein